MNSVYVDGDREAERHKWIESERAQRDLGESAFRQWFKQHWRGYVRARWVEHVEGVRFWMELDRNDFGLLHCEFRDDALLVDRILDRLKAGQENLDVIQWAIEWGIPMDRVLRILEALDINSRRLVHHLNC